MSDEITFTGVHSLNIDGVWGDVKPLIQKAINMGNGEYLIDDVYTAIQNRTMQLWIALSGAEIIGAGCTEIYSYPRQKTCGVRLWASGSPRDKWLEFLAYVEAWAVTNGCDAMEVFGRQGWERVLVDYNKTVVILRKQLEKV